MARRKPHLFELLGRRDHDDPALKRTGSRSKTPSEPTVAQQFQRISTGIGGFVQGLFRRAPASTPVRSTVRGAGRGNVHADTIGITLGGPAVAGVAFLCLALGFALGSWLTPGSGSEDLRMAGAPDQPPAGTAQPERPSTMPERNRSGGVLSADLYTRKASNLFFPLLVYLPHQEQKARALVDYLWENSFEDARLLSSTSRGEPVLVVVVHTISGTDRYAEDAQQKLLDKLKTLSPPAFEPRLAERLTELTLDNLRSV